MLRQGNCSTIALNDLFFATRDARVNCSGMNVGYTGWWLFILYIDLRPYLQDIVCFQLVWQWKNIMYKLLHNMHIILDSGISHIKNTKPENNGFQRFEQLMWEQLALWRKSLFVSYHSMSCKLWKKYEIN